MSNRIYVGKINSSTNESILREAFNSFGKITSVELKSDFAYINFDNSSSVSEAVNKMHGTELDGSVVIVEAAKAFSRNAGGRDSGRPFKCLDLRILVKGLNPRTNWQDLKDWARKSGNVTYANVFEKDGAYLGIIEFTDEKGFNSAFEDLIDTPLLENNVKLEKLDPDSEYNTVPVNRGRRDNRGFAGRDDYRGRSDRNDFDRRGRERDDFRYKGGYENRGYEPYDNRFEVRDDRGYGRAPYRDDFRGGPSGGFYERPRSRSRSRSRDRYQGGGYGGGYSRDNRDRGDRGFDDRNGGGRFGSGGGYNGGFRR